MKKNKICWVMTNNYVGLVNQALGLAEAFANLEKENSSFSQSSVEIIQKKIVLKPFWRLFSPFFTFFKKYCLAAESDTLSPPWPDILIASGRQSIIPALYVKEASKGHTKIIYLQSPIHCAEQFDAIVSPAHDTFSGPNVMTMVGAMHRVSSQRIHDEMVRFKDVLDSFAFPRITVLIGGPNKAYSMDEDFAQDLVNKLIALQQKNNASLLITTSRRTPRTVVAILKQKLTHQTYLYDGEGDNPYFALLGYGDAILLTCDSVCMVSEACATTKPVYMIPLKGTNRKFELFHKNIITTGRVRWFDGELDQTLKECEPFDENRIVAESLKKILNV